MLDITLTRHCTVAATSKPSLGKKTSREPEKIVIVRKKNIEKATGEYRLVDPIHRYLCSSPDFLSDKYLP